MVIDRTDPFKTDPSLIKAIAKAHRFNESLLRSGASKFADLSIPDRDSSMARSCMADSFSTGGAKGTVSQTFG